MQNIFLLYDNIGNLRSINPYLININLTVTPMQKIFMLYVELEFHPLLSYTFSFILNVINRIGLNSIRD